MMTAKQKIELVDDCLVHLGLVSGKLRNAPFHSPAESHVTLAIESLKDDLRRFLLAEHLEKKA